VARIMAWKPFNMKCGTRGDVFYLCFMMFKIFFITGLEEPHSRVSSYLEGCSMCPIRGNFSSSLVPMRLETHR
jgi:hypothetical protein